MGPLNGLKIVEIAGIGPSQFCGMLLADMGAQVIRVARPDTGDPAVEIPARFNLMNRGRPTIRVDLKSGQGVELVLRLCDTADALFEGFRPGVMESLGLGPDDCMVRNQRLVYGRMTGWGQDGPLAGVAGHDTNYIALAGALHAIGPADRPPPIPLNLIGDFGGGALYLAMGLLAAMLEAQRSGKGQVVDAAMVDGAASLLTLFYGLLAEGRWTDRRERNVLDGAAPFVRCYATRDGEYVAVCAIENRFFRKLLEAMEVTEINGSDQYRVESWAEQVAIFERVFATKTRDEWAGILETSETCAMPVLSLVEAPQHPHNRARKTFVTVDGVEQPAPAPRFSRTPSSIRGGPSEAADVSAVLAEWGLGEDDIAKLI